MDKSLKQDLEEAADAIWRDYGTFGQHSKRCVYTEDERGITQWCCADDCPKRRKDS